MEQQIVSCLGRRLALWTHDAPDHMAAAIRAHRQFYEIDVLMKCRELYLPGTAVIDVGANIGNHTVFFAAILGAPVYAFEPDPANHALLALNVAANGLDRRVIATCCALGATNGTATLHPGPAANRGVASVRFGTGETPVHDLDGLNIPDPIGLLKIDVEGSETAVLAGARHLIEDWLPDIVIEAADARAFRDTAATLLDRGYVPCGRHAATPTYVFRAVDQTRRMRRILADTSMD